MAPAGWLENFEKYGLQNMAAHGLSDVEHHKASYFSFSCIPGPLTQRHAHLLKLLVPHLHVALTKALSVPRHTKSHSMPQQASLSNREKEILQWMFNGKSNWEIAKVIGLSEAAVKNHVHHILSKLHAATRTQAVAKALHLKLISGKN
jgi:transcriptional regulator EpsA